MFALKVDGLEKMGEFVKFQNQQRKTWRSELKKYFKEHMTPLLEEMEDDLVAETPYLTGTLQKRASYKFIKWHFIEFGYDEDIEPTANADWRYWRSGRFGASFWEYAYFRWLQGGDFFDRNYWYDRMKEAYDSTLKSHWAEHFNWWKGKGRK